MVLIMNPYDVVDAFEKKVAEYTGAKYGVAVNSCTNALMLSAIYRRLERGTDTAILPSRTYVGVPYAFINAGYKIEFDNYYWKGTYKIKTPTTFLGTHPEIGGVWGLHEIRYEIISLDIIDSARRFTKGMYIPNTLYCVSFHECKTLAIGDGGMILSDDKEAYDALRQMRFDGRTPGKSVSDDEFTLPGYHVHMKPPIATAGLMLMAGVKDFNEDLPETYPDLSQIKYFKGE